MTDVLFNIDKIRRDFPSLTRRINDQALVYLDSAATAQKPQCVIDAISQYYCAASANVHRGDHSLSVLATQRFEAARQTVAHFLDAPVAGIVWTRGATESINLIAQSYARNTLQVGDEILVSEMEHHANIVPWQLVAQQTGARVIKLPINPQNCELDMVAFEQLLNKRTKLVAVAHISNVTGTRNPIEKIICAAHKVGAKVVIDGAQAVVHESISMKTVNADFYVFSGHKLFGPEGIGVLFGKPALLEAMEPWHGGGKIIEKVSFTGTTFITSATKFEAGTPNVAGAIALAQAIDWFQHIDRKGAERHIATLKQQLVDGLLKIDGLKIIGLQPHASVVAFMIDGIHYADISTLLDLQGIALRSGQHCAHPLMDALNITGCLRASIALYNTADDIDSCIGAIHKACEIL